MVFQLKNLKSEEKKKPSQVIVKWGAQRRKMLDVGTRNNSIIIMTIFEHTLYISTHCTRYFHMSFLHTLKLTMQEYLSLL